MQQLNRVGTDPGTVTLQLPNGDVIALPDHIDDKLYATVQFTNATQARLRAFTSGVSQVLPGGVRMQTDVDTNVPRGSDGGLPQDWRMQVYGCGVELTRVTRNQTGFTAIQADSDSVGQPVSFDFNERVFIEYWYNSRFYMQGTLWDFPQGCGMHLYTTLANREVASNGIPNPRDRINLFIPVSMGMNLSFMVQYQTVAAPIINQAAIDGGNPLTFLEAKARLWGLIQRTVVPAS